MPFDTINKGKETEASKAGKTKPGDTKSNPPKGKAVKESSKDVKQPMGNKKAPASKGGKEMPAGNGKVVQQEKKKPMFKKGGKTIKKK